jgi:hypothetical protein
MKPTPMVVPSIKPIIKPIIKYHPTKRFLIFLYNYNAKMIFYNQISSSLKIFSRVINRLAKHGKFREINSEEILLHHAGYNKPLIIFNTSCLA